MHKNPTINFTKKDQNPINFVVNGLSKEGIMSKPLKHSHGFSLQVLSTMKFNYLLNIFHSYFVIAVHQFVLKVDFK